MRTILPKASIFHIIILGLLYTSCTSNSQDTTISKLLVERDSLIEQNREQGERLNSINRLMTTINSAVDSIALAEGMLFISSGNENEISRQSALADLEKYEMLIKRQQQKIRDMRLRLGDQNKEADGIVEIMRQQIKAKDEMIATLKKQLAQKDLDIAALRRTVASQNQNIQDQQRLINELNIANDKHNKALATQDKIINQAMVLIKTKKELQQMGILKKGKLQTDATLNNSSFQKIDIRKVREISFPAKKPKILTPIPHSSYRLMTSGDHNYTLEVTDPTKFWSVSNYLIIQTD